MIQDIRQAVRTLSKHPGFVAIAAAVLGLGIGLNVAIFSIVHTMLFRPWPVKDSHELVSIYTANRRQPDRPHVITNEYAMHFQEHAGVFQDITGNWGIACALTADDETDIVRAEWVMANYFDFLGVSPLLGRAFLPEEDDPANPALAVVIANDLWTRRFRSDPNIVGKQIKIALSGRAQRTYTVIGVAPREFKGISTPWTPTQLWVTHAQSGFEIRAGRRLLYAMAAVARLKPGVTLHQARAVVVTGAIVGESARAATSRCPSANIARGSANT